MQLKNEMKINATEMSWNDPEFKGDLWEVLKQIMLNLEKVVHLHK